MWNIQFLILASMVKEMRCTFLRQGSVFLLRLSSSIVSELWNRIALLNDHRKCSHFAFEISSKRGQVGRSAGKSPSWFSSATTVLFRIQKSHYIARYICSRNLLFLCIARLHYLTYIFLSGQRYFIQMSFFTLFRFHVHGFCHFDSLKYPGFSLTRGPSFLKLFCGRFLHAKREYS